MPAIPASRSSRGRARRRPSPLRKPIGGEAGFVEPMKALGVTSIPAGSWLSEIKFDGYRALAVVRGRRAELWSRNENNLTGDYPEVAAALERLRCREAVLDGEIVSLDTQGRPRFQLLQRRGEAKESGPVFFYLFDLLELDGRSLLDEPIEFRKDRLSHLLGRRSTGPLRLSEVFAVDPAVLLEAVRRQGLEGVVVKAAGSRYEPGRRSGAWLKCRLAHEQEFVIGGFTPPGGSRKHFGAILVGYYRDGRLQYAGKVGTGFDARWLRDLYARFTALLRDDCPFTDLPLPRHSRWGTGMTAREMKSVTWVEPSLVAQIRFSEWTGENLLRQPVFLGLRMDKNAREVVRETVAI